MLERRSPPRTREGVHEPIEQGSVDRERRGGVVPERRRRRQRRREGRRGHHSLRGHQRVQRPGRMRQRVQLVRRQNACKGKGWIESSKAECEKKGGKIVESKHE